MRESHEEHVEHAFDSYCKKVLRNEVRDYYAELCRRGKHEMYINDCFDQLCTEDTCFQQADVFRVFGFEVAISDPTVSSALRILSTEKRDIVLLTCCLDMSDREVAALVSLARRTVAYKRARALLELRGFLRDGQAFT